MDKRIVQFLVVIAVLVVGLIGYSYLNPVVEEQQISCAYDTAGGLDMLGLDMMEFGQTSIDNKEIYVSTLTLTAPENQLVIAGDDGGEHYYRVEVADTPKEHTLGLMHRYRLDKDYGMLFLFPFVQEATFWMKNTYIPLDILFLDATGVVVKIYENTTPRSEEYLEGGGLVKAVLEINAGDVRRLGVSVGAQVYHSSFE